MWHESAKGRGASQDRTTSSIMRSNTMASFWADAFTAKKEEEQEVRTVRREERTGVEGIERGGQSDEREVRKRGREQRGTCRRHRDIG